MKTIIAGSRSIASYDLVAQAVAESGFKITEVVSGGADGVDYLGELWADNHGLEVARFPAKWHLHGKSAGPIRNAEMAGYADALIAIRSGGASSRGTTHMIHAANKLGLKVFVKDI